MNKITFPLSRPMQGAAVADLHQALLLLFRAGALFGDDPAALRAAQAGLARELDEKAYGPSTTKAVTQFQKERRLDATGAVDETTAKALNEALQDLDGAGPSGPSTGPQARVGGFIRYEHGLPAEDLALRLYRQEFGGKSTKIAETRTHQGGRYAFTLDGQSRMGSVEIRAVTANGKEVALSKPLHHLTAENRGRVNLVAPAKLRPLPAEYPRLRADLEPHVGELRHLATATEDTTRRDLTVLHQATGWDARLIGLAAVSERLAADPEVELPSEGLYGLLRVGLPSDKHLLAQVPLEAVELALRKAEASGVVALDDGQRAAFTKKFGAFAARTRLLLPAPGSRSSYRELLQGSGLSEEAQRKFAAAYFKHGGGPGLWPLAQDAGLNAEEVRTLQLQGKFAFLAGNSAAMTARILKKGLTEPAQLAERDLFEAEAWKAEILGEAEIPEARWGAMNAQDQERLAAVVPAAFQGEKVEGRLEAYAEDLARKVRLSYPTQVLGRLMEKDPKFALKAGHDVTLRLLKNATAQGFRLGETPVARFLRQRPNVNDGLTEAEFKEAQAQLGALTRIYQLTPSNAAMPVLMGLGVTAAYDVMAYTQEEFIAIFNDKYVDIHQSAPPPGVAVLVYQKAQQVSSVTYNLFAIAKKLAGDLPVAGLSAPVQARESARNELIKHFPTMESLFGPMDYCDCEHCRSVLSPAAYLVDLLQFVDAEPSVWANFLAHWNATHHNSPYPHPKPYEVLVERRPDLAHLALTCENTHTALPYIDIVNEILEYYVAHGRLAKEAARDTDGSTTAELLAEPQNVIQEAYDSLRGAAFPLNLPFDLWLETVRKFCDYFETPLHRVLEVMRPEQGLEARIQAPTNVGQATVDVANSEAGRLQTGLSVTYRSARNTTLSGEWRRITVIGAADSGGPGWSRITFVGTWAAPPAAGDLLVVRPIADRAAVFTESLGLAPAEVALFTDPEPFTNDRWHHLYGLPAVRSAIGAPTNVGQATLTVPNADALKLRTGLPYGYFRIAANAASNESQILAAIGAPDSGGAGRATLTFEGVWAVAPAPGDLLTCDARSLLSSAKALARRLGVTYEELAQLVQCTFVNPEVAGLSLLHKLGVAVFDAKLYQDERAYYEANKDLLGKVRTGLSAADQLRFDALAAVRPNRTLTGWQVLSELDALEQRLTALGASFSPPRNVADLKNALLAIPFARILVLADPDASCNFERTRFQYADGGKADPIAFLRINLLVRLWRRLGWSLEETDRALVTFTPTAAPFDATLANLAKQPLKTTLANLAHLKALDATLKVGKRSRLKLLCLWGDIGTSGQASLYAELFLRRSVLKASTAFDDPLGQYLRAPGVLLSPHLLALQGALGLTAAEIRAILEDSGLVFDTAVLSLGNVSRLYRYALLAKGLGLSVTDLITLKRLSGLDPFKALHPDPLEALDQDYALVETLEFVQVAAEVKESGLSLDDLNYLVRHHFDEVGKYRPTPDATLGLLRGLAEGVRSIRAAHAAPRDEGGWTEDFLRQELGLALPPAEVDRFLGMVHTTGEFTATVQGVLPADTLARLLEEANKPANANDELARRVVEQRYEEVPLKAQSLTLRGVVLDPAPLKAKFQGALSAGQNATFDQLLREHARSAREFFDAHLKKQRLRVDGEAGFLEESDFTGTAQVPSLFGALEPKEPILGTDSAAEVARKERDNRNVEQRNQLELARRRARVGGAFLPFLQARLIRQWVNETLATATSADPRLVDSLIGDDRLLGLPNALLPTLVNTAERGVDATFWPSADATGAPSPTATLLSADTNGVDPSGRTLRPAGADSARLEGYLEVPTTGAYRFYVELDRQNARAELRFPHRTDPVLVRGTAAADRARLGDGPEEYLELKAGVLYRWSLDLTRLNGGGARLLVQGAQLPRGPLSQLKVCPARTIEAGTRATVLLEKALQLVQALGLSEVELGYLLSHAPDFGGVRLGDLPLSPVGDTAADRQSTARRFGWFRRLAAYAKLKRELAPGTDDLLGIFEANGTTAPGRLEALVYPRIAQLTRRDPRLVKATAEILVSPPDAPHFESERPLLRLWEALKVVERFGLEANTMAGWRALVALNTTGAQRFELAREAKEAIKARFEPEVWQRVAKPIFDQLRPQQRDALVSHVMHQQQFERIEQLYEYFLIDPGMEPVVQTSRIRLAIASVQLFIQRSLLNLEAQVHPAVINAEQWEWMKRYRVWEANRKIFLFPENWLEPEFRDDKTHLYAELEGALLQGDVSSDLVEDAFLNYLRKLDGLARLDICAMHLQDHADPSRRVLHVFGRSYAQPHEYFYRRYAHQMWTPWEPVSAEIEGDHLAPVVWRDRLYLFWVTFLDQNDSAPSATDPTGSKKVIDVELKEAMSYVNTAAGTKRVGVQLHWSEYLGGEWTTRASGGYPEVITRTVPASFDKSGVFVHVSKDYGTDGAELGVKIHLGGAINAAYHLAGRNSTPEVASYQSKPDHLFSANVESAVRYRGNGALRVTFRERLSTRPDADNSPVTRDVLKKGLDPGQAYTLLPSNNDLTALGLSEDAYLGAANPAAVEAALRSGLGEIADLMRPVFYQDQQHTFFVEPDVTERTIEEFEEWVTRTVEVEPEWIDQDWWEDLVVVPAIPRVWPIPEFDPDDPRPSPIDEGSLIYPKPMGDWLINPGSVLRFGDVLIGPSGQPGLEILDRADPVADAEPVNVNPGHDLPAGRRVMVVDGATLTQSGLEVEGGGLNIVGAAGFNATLMGNYLEMDGASGGAGAPPPGGWMPG